MLKIKKIFSIDVSDIIRNDNYIIEIKEERNCNEDMKV